MASFIRQNSRGAIFIKLGKRDNVDALEIALRKHGVRIECACDCEALCYCDSYHTDAGWRDLLKVAQKRLGRGYKKARHPQTIAY
jgi:hypothetical protein